MANAAELGGNAEVTGYSNVDVLDDMHEKIDMASAADFDTFKAQMISKFGDETFEQGYKVIKDK